MNARRRSARSGLLVCALVLAAGCADRSVAPSVDDTSDASVVSQATDVTSEVPRSTPPTTATEGSIPLTSEQIDPGLAPYVDIAIGDLATRLSVDRSQITTTSATLVQWPDSSLGCPAPGQQYAQVLTDGSVIVLTAGGDEYRYHSGGSRTPFFCEKPS
jgi:hypothetical protein